MRRILPFLLSQWNDYSCAAGNIIIERSDENKRFYGRAIKASEILSEDSRVEVPPGTEQLHIAIAAAEGQFSRWEEQQQKEGRRRLSLNPPIADRPPMTEEESELEEEIRLNNRMSSVSANGGYDVYSSKAHTSSGAGPSEMR